MPGSYEAQNHSGYFNSLSSREENLSNQIHDVQKGPWVDDGRLKELKVQRLQVADQKFGL